MSRHHAADTVELRRSALRLQQLGVLRAFVPDDERAPSQYVSTTVAGDTLVVPRAAAGMYLQGLAHGAYVERWRAAQSAAAVGVVPAPQTDGRVPPAGRPLFLAPD